MIALVHLISEQHFVELVHDEESAAKRYEEIAIELHDFRPRNEGESLEDYSYEFMPSCCETTEWFVIVDETREAGQ